MKLKVSETIVFKRPRVCTYRRKNHGSQHHYALSNIIVIETETGRKLTWSTSRHRHDVEVGDTIEATFNVKTRHPYGWVFIKNPRKLRVLETAQQKVWKAKTPIAKDKLLQMFINKDNPINYLDASAHPEDKELSIAAEAVAQLGGPSIYEQTQYVALDTL